MKRNEFLQMSALASASLLVPRFIHASARNTPMSAERRKRLVVIQLSGGNDGLNTVVPFMDDRYYQARPKIALAGSAVLKLDEYCGIHPELPVFRELYDAGDLAILNAVGYPNPNRSHFRSMDIWQSASDAEQYLQTGWIGRYLDAQCAGCSSPADAIELDDMLSLALKGDRIKGLAMSNPEKLFRLSHSPIITPHATNTDHADHPQVEYLYKTLAETTSSVDFIYEKSKLYTSTAIYPLHPFAQRMRTIAGLIVSGAQSRLYYASLGGFDTHAAQPGTQNRLFRQLNGALQAFTAELKANDFWKDTLILVFSEFGRRVKENAGRGTDHGAANVLFIAGGSLKRAGRVNEMPDLSDLDDGDVRFRIDFRQVYSELLERWLETDPNPILNKKFSGIGII
jgi:uncharacterized protein (DUF1501 family)